MLQVPNSPIPSHLQVSQCLQNIVQTSWILRHFKIQLDLALPNFISKSLLSTLSNFSRLKWSRLSSCSTSAFSEWCLLCLELFFLLPSPVVQILTVSQALRSKCTFLQEIFLKLSPTFCIRITAPALQVDHTFLFCTSYLCPFSFLY